MSRVAVAVASLAPLGFGLAVLAVLAGFGVVGWMVVVTAAAAAVVLGGVCWWQLGRRRVGVLETADP